MSQAVFSINYKAFNNVLKIFKNVCGKDSRVIISTDPIGEIYFLSADKYEVKLKVEAVVNETISKIFEINDLMSIKGSAKINVDFYEHDTLSMKVDALGSTYIKASDSSVVPKSFCSVKEDAVLTTLNNNTIHSFSKIISSKYVSDWFINQEMMFVKYGKSYVTYLSPVFSAFKKVDEVSDTYYIPIELIKSGIFKEECSIIKINNVHTLLFGNLSISYTADIYQVNVNFPSSYTHTIKINYDQFLNAVLNISDYERAGFNHMSSDKAEVYAGDKVAALDVYQEKSVPLLNLFMFSPDLLLRALGFLHNEEKSLINMKLFVENNVVKYVHLSNDDGRVLVSCLK